MDNTVKLYWLRDYRNNPVACIASKLVKENDTVSGKFSLSIQNPADKFSKVFGRKIALDRLELDIKTTAVKFPASEDVKLNLLKSLMSLDYVPSRIKDHVDYEIWFRDVLLERRNLESQELSDQPVEVTTEN